MEKVNQKNAAKKRFHHVEAVDVELKPVTADIWERIEARVRFDLAGVNSIPPHPAIKWQIRI